MKRLFCLLLVSAFMLSCADGIKPDGTKLEPRRTVIAGVVENYTDDMQVLRLNYCDKFNDKERYFQNIIKSGGQFQAENDYLFAQDISIMLDNEYISVFVSPGDSIFIRIDAAKIHDDLENAVRFSGDNADRNAEFFKWTRHSSKIFGDLEFDPDCPSERFLESIGEKLKIVKDSINAYDRRVGMSDFLKEWAFINQKFLMANNLGPDDFRKAGFREILDALDTFNDNNFQSYVFQCDLGTFVNGLMTSDDEILKLYFIEGQHAAGLNMTIDKLLKNVPKGIFRDAMLFSLLKYASARMPDVYGSLPDVGTAFSNDFFADKLKETADNYKINKAAAEAKLADTDREFKGIMYLNGEHVEKLPDVKLMNHLAEKHKGKVVYIDVWATWCGPCLNEIATHAPVLHEKFKGKDVVFVNLCLRSKPDQWVQIVNAHNMGENNYFLDDYTSELFRADNNIPHYPSYLIIDKEGKLHNPVPRPSELAEAIKKIESLLK